VLLCQKLAREAEVRVTQPSDFDKGIGVSLMHDAVELFLWTACKVRHANVGDKTAFDDVLTKLEATLRGAQLPMRASLVDLNKARVGFKHYGLKPSAMDAVRLVGYGRAFIELAGPVVGLDVYGVTRAQLVEAESVRVHLLSAEKALAGSDFERAMYYSALAVYEARKLFGVLLQTHPSIASKLARAFPDGPARVAMQGYFAHIDDTLKRLTLAVQASRMPSDPERDAKFARVAPQIVRTATGKETVSHQAPITSEYANFCVEYALEYGLTADRRAR
jgi:hypothetical protein